MPVIQHYSDYHDDEDGYDGRGGGGGGGGGAGAPIVGPPDDAFPGVKEDGGWNQNRRLRNEVDITKFDAKQVKYDEWTNKNMNVLLIDDNLMRLRWNDKRLDHCQYLALPTKW